MNNQPERQETEEEKRARIASRKILTPKRRLPQAQGASSTFSMSPPSTSPVFPAAQSPPTASAPSNTAPMPTFSFTASPQQPTTTTSYSVVSPTPVQAVSPPAFPSATESTSLKRKPSDQISREGSNKMFHGSSPLSQSWSVEDSASKSTDSGLFGAATSKAAAATPATTQSTFAFAATVPSLQRQDSQQAQVPTAKHFSFPSNPSAAQSEKPTQAATTTTTTTTSTLTTPTFTGFGTNSTAAGSTSNEPTATTSAAASDKITAKHVHFNLPGEDKHQDKAKEKTTVTATAGDGEKDKGKEKTVDTRIPVPPLLASKEKTDTTSTDTSSIFGPPRSTQAQQTVLQTSVKSVDDITGRTRIEELPPEALHEVVAIYNMIQAQKDLADDMENGTLSYHGEQIRRIGFVVDQNLKQIPVTNSLHKRTRAEIGELERKFTDQRQYAASVGKFIDLKRKNADTGPVPDFDRVYAELLNDMYERCLNYKSKVNEIEDQIRQFSVFAPTPNDVAVTLDRLVITSQKMAVKIDQIHREVERIKSIKSKKVAG